MAKQVRLLVMGVCGLGTIEGNRMTIDDVDVIVNFGPVQGPDGDRWIVTDAASGLAITHAVVRSDAIEQARLLIARHTDAFSRLWASTHFSNGVEIPEQIRLRMLSALQKRVNKKGAKCRKTA